MVIATFFIISPSTRIPPPHRNTDKPSGYFPAYPCVPLSGHRERFSPSASATNKLIPSVPVSGYLPDVRPHPARPHSRCLCCNGSRGGSAHPLPEACGAGSHFRHDGYKMIPHCAETSRFVVTEQLLGGVIPGGACGAAMNDDIFHGSGGCHHRAVLLSEESTFVRDLFLTDYHRESFLNHG